MFKRFHSASEVMLARTDPFLTAKRLSELTVGPDGYMGLTILRKVVRIFFECDSYIDSRCRTTPRDPSNLVVLIISSMK